MSLNAIQTAVLAYVALKVFEGRAQDQPNIQNSRFAAVGDIGSSNSAKTRDAILSIKPELFLGLGDYSYYEAAIEPWFTSFMKPIIDAGIDYRLNLGNHDFGNGSQVHPCKWDLFWNKFSSKFPGGRLYFSENRKNVHILNIFAPNDNTLPGSVTPCPGKTQADIDRVLDLIADNNYTTAAQINFVRDDLEAARANPGIQWIIVCMHEPMYPVGNPGAPGLASIYHPIFDEFGVDLVLSGDRHNYQRTYPTRYNPANPAMPEVTDTSANTYDWRANPARKALISNVLGTGGQPPSGKLPTTKPTYIARMFDGIGVADISIENSADYTKLTSKFVYFPNSFGSTGGETFSIIKPYKAWSV